MIHLRSTPSLAAANVLFPAQSLNTSAAYRSIKLGSATASSSRLISAGNLSSSSPANFRKSDGKSLTRIVPLQRATAYSIADSNSRTLPGQEYCSSTDTTPEEK